MNDPTTEAATPPLMTAFRILWRCGALTDAEINTLVARWDVLPPATREKLADHCRETGREGMLP